MLTNMFLITYSCSYIIVFSYRNKELIINSWNKAMCFCKCVFVCVFACLISYNKMTFLFHKFPGGEQLMLV